MTSIQTSKRKNEDVVFTIFQDQRQKHHSIFKVGQVVPKADIKNVFSKRDSTNCFCEFYTITEIIQDTIHSYRNDYLPKGFKENLFRLTILTLDEKLWKN